MNKAKVSQKLVAASGQTMVDLLISLALLALAAISSSTLANSSFNVGQESGRRSQASALGSHDLEGLITINDALAKQSPSQKLWDWLGTSGSSYTTSGNCRQFYVVRSAVTPSNPTGWNTLSLPNGANQPKPFTSSDELGDPNYTNYGGFARLIQLCQMPNYVQGQGYVGVSSTLYQVNVRVYWQEGSNGPFLIPGTLYNRQLIMTSILATPGKS